MRTSSATWPLFRDVHGRWPWDPWCWFHGCGCSSCVAPTQTMQETMFLPHDRRRASNLERNNRVRNGPDLAAKLAVGALSPGFPSLRSAARTTRDKNFDNPIHAFFCVSRFTDRVGGHARGIAHWLRSFATTTTGGASTPPLCEGIFYVVRQIVWRPQGPCRR
jgi:hypothetical protein